MKQKVKLEKMPWNHKHVYRVYYKLKLNIHIKPEKVATSMILQASIPGNCH